MVSVGRFRWLALGGLAWVGIVAGHVLSYVLTYSDPIDRTAHLAVSGHHSFPIQVASGLAIVPAILVLLAVRAVRGPAAPPPGRMTVRLAAIQVPAFLVMELWERAWSLDSFSSEPAILLGIVIQVLVAGASAMLCRAFVRVVRALAEWISASTGGKVSPIPSPVLRAERHQQLLFLIGSPRRAPPASIAA
jgi:hypothetical protein